MRVSADQKMYPLLRSVSGLSVFASVQSSSELLRNWAYLAWIFAPPQAGSSIRVFWSLCFFAGDSRRASDPRQIQSRSFYGRWCGINFWYWILFCSQQTLLSRLRYQSFLLFCAGLEIWIFLRCQDYWGFLCTVFWEHGSPLILPLILDPQ